ncbi:MAG: 2-oxoacid:acceptor oxidoreductase family protein [Candidatus Baldrarchaeia archaeon]
MKKYNILVAGVGGQGVITVGRLLKRAGLRKGYIVVGTETRGASQREGPVDSAVRYVILEDDEKFDPRRCTLSPIIPMGDADMVMCLESNEALRVSEYISSKSYVLINDYQILPTRARSFGLKMPPTDTIANLLKKITPNVRVVNASAVSEREFGDLTKVNMIMLGVALALGVMPLSFEDIEVTLREMGFSEDNIRAIRIGMKLMEGEV